MKEGVSAEAGDHVTASLTNRKADMQTKEASRKWDRSSCANVAAVVSSASEGVVPVGHGLEDRKTITNHATSLNMSATVTAARCWLIFLQLEVSESQIWPLSGAFTRCKDVAVSSTRSMIIRKNGWVENITFPADYSASVRWISKQSITQQIASGHLKGNMLFNF